MTSSLERCTAEEQRSVFTFLVAESIKGNEIHKRMLKVYENNCWNRSNVYKWVEQF